MNWKGFSLRIVLVIVAFPVLAVLIILVPHLHHLGFNIVVLAASVLGALEMGSLFHSRKIPTSLTLAPILAATLPAGAYLEVAHLIPVGWMGVWMPAALAVILMRAVIFKKEKKLTEVLAYASSSTFTFLYPALFLSWVVRISGLAEPTVSILLFLCLVFGNDMAAYLAGSLWGASTRLNLPVSPQKSAVGFAAGLAGSLIVMGLFLLLTPGFPRFGIGTDIALALATGVTVILGDFLESGLKRSAGVKDSGVAIPGRGGMLDSVDSMLLTAPLFFYFFVLVGR